MEAEPEEISEGPDDGVYIYGLWMEGARFDRAKWLIQPSVPGEMYTVRERKQYKRVTKPRLEKEIKKNY